MTRVAPEHLPGSDTRVREAGEALSRDLRGGFSFVRERQWFRPSGGGEILVMPECYRPESEIAGAGS